MFNLQYSDFSQLGRIPNIFWYLALNQHIRWPHNNWKVEAYSSLSTSYLPVFVACSEEPHLTSFVVQVHCFLPLSLIHMVRHIEVTSLLI